MLQQIATARNTRTQRRWQTPTLRNAGFSLCVAAALAVWLAALPGLLLRDGRQAGNDGCGLRSYRDPVTGRNMPPPSAAPRPRSAEACQAGPEFRP